MFTSRIAKRHILKMGFCQYFARGGSSSMPIISAYRERREAMLSDCQTVQWIGCRNTRFPLFHSIKCELRFFWVLTTHLPKFSSNISWICFAIRASQRPSLILLTGDIQYALLLMECTWMFFPGKLGTTIWASEHCLSHSTSIFIYVQSQLTSACISMK